MTGRTGPSAGLLSRHTLGMDLGVKYLETGNDSKCLTADEARFSNCLLGSPVCESLRYLVGLRVYIEALLPRTVPEEPRVSFTLSEPSLIVTIQELFMRGTQNQHVLGCSEGTPLVLANEMDQGRQIPTGDIKQVA